MLPVPFSSHRVGVALVAVVAFHLLACGDSGTGLEAPSLEVTVSTTGTDLDPDGYTVIVDGDRSEPVPIDGRVVFDLPEGEHTVELSGVAANCQVGGENPRRVDLVAGQSTTAAFGVTCSAPSPGAGTLQITVATSGENPDPDGYTLRVDAGAAQPIGANGTTSVPDVPAGEHRVELGGVAPNCRVEGANPRTAVVSAGETTVVDFVVACLASEPWRVVFVSARDGLPEVYIVNEDGSGLRNLSRHPAPDFYPTLSPDNRKVAFVSDRDRGDSEIYVVNVDGTNLTRLTTAEGSDWAPAWSPDGTRIAFMSTRDGGDFQLYTMNADGSGQVRLAPGENPQWSPDGRLLLAEHDADILVVGADGSNPVNLTASSAPEYAPTWSPDGRRVAFTRRVIVSFEEEVFYDDVWAINTDGTGETQLTRTRPDPAGHGASHPAWSPDGGLVLFRSDTPRNPFHDLYTVRPDGSRLTRLTDTPDEAEFRPVWSPDGRKIVFRKVVGSAPDVFIMNADGTGTTNLSNHPGFDALRMEWRERFHD